ncbi:MAG: hypothetical protein OT477_11605 [Chloroflexi bacterium]|nr:hypothetical protein [Chloroflexota bacterium]
MTDEIYDLKDQEKAPQTKHEWDSTHSGLLVGIVFIMAGAVLLLGRWTELELLENWWALFILIPAFSSLGRAMHIYKRRGRLGHEGGGALTGGLIILGVALTFLFGLSWSYFWPFILIIVGISSLIQAKA